MPIHATPIIPIEGRPVDDVLIDHDTGGIDAYRVVRDGQGVGNVDVRLYLASEFAASPTTAKLRGRSRTRDDGRWENLIGRDPQLAYTLVFLPADGSPATSINLAANT